MAVKTTKLNDMYDYINDSGQRVIRPTSSVSTSAANTAQSAVQNAPSMQMAQNNQNNVYLGGGMTTDPAGQSQSAARYGKNPTELTAHYRDRMLATDDQKPGAFTSRYDAQINDILDTIYNRKAFNLDDDANYNQLYNNYKERYTANADRAMRDTLASANAATGGYGSTYGQVASQQAYDQTMEGLNDQNLTLAQLAYQMYGDEFNRNLSTLGAYQGQDAVDYSRYRDTVGDWQADRNYYAGRYDNSWNADYTEYSNALNTAMSLAEKGLPVPDYLTAVIDRYNGANGLSSGSAAATLAGLASQVTSGNGSGGGKQKTEETVPTVVKTTTKPLTSYTDTTNQLAVLDQLLKSGQVSQSDAKKVQSEIIQNSFNSTVGASAQKAAAKDYLTTLTNKKFKVK